MPAQNASLKALLLAALLVGPMEAQSIAGQEQVSLTPEVFAHVEALESSSNWKGLASYIDTLPPAGRKELLATHLKALSKSEQWEAMRQLCEKMIPMLDGPRPRLSVARIGLGQALGRLKRHHEAAKVQMENGALGYADGWGNALGEARNTQDFNFVIDIATKVGMSKPGFAESGALRGEALAKLGRFAEAEPFLMEATARLPRRATAWADLSCCQHERGATEEALASATHALTLDPKLIEARYNQARALMSLNRYPEAREALTAVLSLEPGPEAKSSLETLLMQVDRYLESMKRAQTRTTQAPKPRKR